MASRVRGLERLRRQLKQLPNSVRVAMAEALEAAAADMAQAIARAAPVAAVDGGDLRRSVGSGAGPPPPTNATGALRPKGPLKAIDFALAGEGLLYSVWAGDDKAFYARWVEFGTAAKAAQAPRQNRKYKRTLVMTKASRAHAATRAQPFFYPTIRARKKPLRSRVLRATNKAAKAVRDLK